MFTSSFIFIVTLLSVISLQTSPEHGVTGRLKKKTAEIYEYLTTGKQAEHHRFTTRGNINSLVVVLIAAAGDTNPKQTIHVPLPL